MRALTPSPPGHDTPEVQNTPSRSCVFMMDTAADDSELNLEQGRALEFAPSSTMKPFAAAVDGDADSYQRSTTNFMTCSPSISKRNLSNFTPRNSMAARPLTYELRHHFFSHAFMQTADIL